MAGQIRMMLDGSRVKYARGSWETNRLLCLAKLEPGSLLVLVCAPPLVRRAVPGQVVMRRLNLIRSAWPGQVIVRSLKL